MSTKTISISSSSSTDRADICGLFSSLWTLNSVGILVDRIILGSSIVYFLHLHFWCHSCLLVALPIAAFNNRHSFWTRETHWLWTGSVNMSTCMEPVPSWLNISLCGERHVKEPLRLPFVSPTVAMRIGMHTFDCPRGIRSGDFQRMQVFSFVSWNCERE